MREAQGDSDSEGQWEDRIYEAMPLTPDQGLEQTAVDSAVKNIDAATPLNSTFRSGPDWDRTSDLPRVRRTLSP